MTALKAPNKAFDEVVDEITKHDGDLAITSWAKFQKWGAILRREGGVYDKVKKGAGGYIHQIKLELGTKTLYLRYQP